MSLYNDLTTVLTPYANKINQNESDISDIQETLTDVAELEKSDLTGTKTTAKTINGSAVVIDATAAYYVMSFDVAEGDKLLISGSASNNGYLYIFTDVNDTAIAHYPTKNTSGALKNYSDIEATAPQGAVKLIVASHLSVSYTQAKADRITGYRVIGLDELGNEVDEISQRVTVVEQDIDGNKAKVNSIFEYSVKTETGEMIGAFSELSGLNIENANSAIIRSAQIFESLYSGGSVAGVTITKNNDGTYTLNGTATTSVGFHLNQSTRTGHDKLVQMDGNYSCRLEILSGKANSPVGTFGRFIIADYYDDALHNVNDLSMWLTDYDNVIENKSTGGTINAIISFCTVSNCTYDNLTFRISVNKGEKVLDTDSEYVEPITITDMSSALEKAKKCLPYIWIITTPNTATITAIGKTVKGVETPEPVEPVELYSVLVKYNDRVDILAQLFGRQLFLVYTDIHASLANLQRINTWVENNKTSVYVSDTYCLGDMLYDHPGDDKPITAFDDVPIWGKTLKVIGNHDVGWIGSSEITAKQIYDTYIKPYVSDWGVVQPLDAETDGKSYYYKDYDNKIRIIVLDIYHYDTAQSTWFETVLETARTNNLAVIVAQHADICTALEKAPLNSEYPFARKYNGYTGLQYSSSYVSERTSVDSFIENGGTFICWLTGHMHVDMTGTYTGEHGKQLSIVLSNASLGIQSSIRINNYSQDCFTYLAVDTDLHYLYLVRIGEAVDKWYHQNLFMCYDYVNHSVVEYH